MPMCMTCETLCIKKKCVICGLGNAITSRDMENVKIHVNILKLATILDLCKLKCMNKGT